MNRKSVKRYTLVLTGPQIRALHTLSHHGLSALRRIDQLPYYLGPPASIHAGERAVRMLDEVEQQVRLDEATP